MHVPGINLVLKVNYTLKTDKFIEKEIRFGTSTCGSGGWSKGTGLSAARQPSPRGVPHDTEPRVPQRNATRESCWEQTLEESSPQGEHLLSYFFNSQQASYLYEMADGHWNYCAHHCQIHGLREAFTCWVTRNHSVWCRSWLEFYAKWTACW